MRTHATATDRLVGLDWAETLSTGDMSGSSVARQQNQETEWGIRLNRAYTMPSVPFKQCRWLLLTSNFIPDPSIRLTSAAGKACQRLQPQPRPLLPLRLLRPLRPLRPRLI